MASPNKTHYYHPDGDVVLCVGSEHFRVHSFILRRVSGFFTSVLSDKACDDCPHSVPQLEKPSNLLATVRLEGNDPSSIESLLSILYPHTLAEVSWDDVAAMLSLADELAIPIVTAKCERFLKTQLPLRAMEVLVLADKYGFSELFKEASAVVLDKYDQNAREEAERHGLSLATKHSLLSVRMEFIEGLIALKLKTTPQCLHQNCACLKGVIKVQPPVIDDAPFSQIISHWIKYARDAGCCSTAMGRVGIMLKLREKAIIVGEAEYRLYIELEDREATVGV